MFYLYTSNRLEYLVQYLTQVVTHPPLNPLQKEIIVVQSKGMERWISMQLAERLGVWTNGYFPFLDTLLWKLFKETLGKLPDTSYFEPDVMTWSLMAMLPNFLNMPDFAELRHYLHKDDQELKRFQLAQRIADIFDQYTIFRPQMIMDWKKGNTTDGWQAKLWRDLIRRYESHEATHNAELRHHFLKYILETNSNNKLPSRLSIFGIPAFPPFYLELFAKLGDIIDIHVFLLNPCRYYWSDNLSERDIARRSLTVEKPELLHLDKGNSLLSSLGKLGSEFTKLLEDYNPQKAEIFENPSDVQCSLLTAIQSDILESSERDTKTVIDINDKSIQIHVCHSQMREVEVLYDQLLALFEAEPTLLPKDILVMMPAVEIYAPFIQAVFSTTRYSTKQIPFTIADRSLRGESSLIDTFLVILELPKGRFTVNEVLAILETEAVQRRFGLSNTDLALIHHWIQCTAVRWGIDGTDRQRRQLPALEENTWRAGLRRLLFGYALPGQDKDLFCGILPFNAIEGQNTLVLGKLCEFVERLFICERELTQPRTLTVWRDFLLTCLEQFFLPTTIQESQAQQIREVLSQLAINGELAKFDKITSWEVIFHYLRQRLEREGEPMPLNFLSGNVSFCALLPMRSIPFKVICLLGMNDQAYPRLDQPLCFDLIAKSRKPGDRSRRDSDRYLFLEALLSARAYFYLSYVGFNIRDNSVIPPSVLVSELEDYIKKNFVLPTDQKIVEHIITKHPLQPFSPRYFDETSKLFSYSSEYCVASINAIAERRMGKPFIVESLPLPTTQWKMVNIEQFCRFFMQPTEFFIRNRLGIQLLDKKPLEKTEPFVLDRLDKYILEQQLVEKALSGQTLEDYYVPVKASGQLPHGNVGDTVYKQLITQITPFIERVRLATAQPRLEKQEIHLIFEELQLNGWLGDIYTHQRIYYRYTTLKAKDFIRVWICHLLLNSLSDKTLPKSSVLIGKNEMWQYTPIIESMTILQTLVRWYVQGLQMPLPFFPSSSMAFVEALTKKSEQEALNVALKTWQGSGEYSLGEVQDAYYQLCFRHVSEESLFNQSFKEITQLFFQPLLQHRVAIL